MIAQQATEGQFDLVVMGSHGRTGLGRLFMGSVAERVLRAATCPVLIVRTPLRQAPAAAEASRAEAGRVAEVAK